MVLQSKYKIGDIIFSSGAEWTAFPIDCPVCAGTGYVIVKPSNADDSAGKHYRCRNCDRSPHGLGRVTDVWKHIPVVRTYTVLDINASINSGVTTIDYVIEKMSGGGTRSIEEKYTSPTYADAMKKAEGMAIAASANAATTLAMKTAKQYEDAAWRVGYHFAELQKLYSGITYHEQQLRILSDHRKLAIQRDTMCPCTGEYDGSTKAILHG